MHGLKLLAISLQACKFTKNERLHTFFQGFQLDFKLLFVLFLGIISWKGASHLSGEGLFFRGVFICKWGRTPWGASVLMGGILKKVAKPPFKSANCPSPPFLGNLPSILVFHDPPPPPKSQIFQWTPKNIKVFHT